MANTALLRYKVEPYIRAKLEGEFGQPFDSKRLRLPGGATHEFDAVSRDGTVVVSIKTSSGLTSGGKRPGGKISNCTADLYYLSLLSCPVRRLVLTNPDFYGIFTRVMHGAIAEGIDVVLVPLPPELQAEVDGVIAEASNEIDRGKAIEAIAVAIEEEAEEKVNTDGGATGDLE
jgi:hypothetical protein